jgi:SpoVK/Ycf46/Vps4 family AAA+-type ATPase
MNQNLKCLIRSVAENNLQKAKQFAKLIVDSDKTQSNKGFCNTINNMLQTSAMNLIELPHDIKGILHMEDVSVSFNEDRYFLSDREYEVAEEVFGMYQTSQKLSELGINYLNSLMLHGVSGTGKTLFGRYIAYKLDLPFAYMNFSNAISSYLGSTAKNISKAFEHIEKQKCVFMVDEVDAIGMRRGKEDVGEMARITIGLMQALDCIKNDTIVISATNRIDMIDPALLRRFAIVHEVKRLTPEELTALIYKYLNAVGIKYDAHNIISYCENSENTQALVINDVIRSIAKSIRFGTEFVLGEVDQAKMKE